MRLLAGVASLAVGIVSHEPPPNVELTGRASADAVLAFRVADGYHVQANPAADEFLIPTSLELRNGCGVKIGAPTYPPAIAFRLEGTDRELQVWEGPFQIVVPLRARRFAGRDECVLEGTLVFQACDERTCLPPASLEVVVPIVWRNP